MDMNELAKLSNNSDSAENFYPPEIYFTHGDNLGKSFEKKFKNSVKITEEEIKFIDDVINKVVAAKKGQPVIISFATFKGGAGKTTTATTFGQFLRNLGYSTLIIDCDYQYHSLDTIKDRAAVIARVIADMTDKNQSIEEIQRFKDSIDPIVESDSCEFGALYPTLNQQILSGKYQVIILDTPGIKTSATKCFNASAIGKPTFPHSFVGYVSDAIVIPCQPSVYDRKGSIDYYIQLESFLNEMAFKKMRGELSYKMLLSQVDHSNDKSVLETMNIFDANGINYYNSHFRTSEKYKNSVKEDSYETFFTINNAVGKFEEFKDIVMDVFKDLNEAKLKDEFLSSQESALSQRTVAE